MLLPFIMTQSLTSTDFHILSNIFRSHTCVLEINKILQSYKIILNSKLMVISNFQLIWFLEIESLHIKGVLLVDLLIVSSDLLQASNSDHHDIIKINPSIYVFTKTSNHQRQENVTGSLVNVLKSVSINQF
jgi:hypothetical protein